MKDTLNPSLEMVQPRKTCPFLTERLLMECKESNQTNKQKSIPIKLVAMETQPCVMIKLLLKSTTMYVVSENMLFEETPLIPYQIRDN